VRRPLIQIGQAYRLHTGPSDLHSYHRELLVLQRASSCVTMTVCNSTFHCQRIHLVQGYITNGPKRLAQMQIKKRSLSLDIVAGLNYHKASETVAYKGMHQRRSDT
jgi:hypothetical protein